jgi:bifunctional oligoribonuclease and PAP phosphatase NrnA
MTAVPPQRDPGGGPEVDAAAVAEILSDPARRFVVSSHRNPDGDALGSMIGLARAMRAAGRDTVMWHQDADPVPAEFHFLLADGEEILNALPADMQSRTVLAVDCATADRLAATSPRELARVVVNIDHHHDNTRFGDLNLVDGGASSSAEMVARVLDAAGFPITPEVAEPLYVGLVTDTGRFGYSNTSHRAHELAARLVDTGIDLPGITRRLYEQQPLSRVLLTGRALASARSLVDGQLMVAVLGPEDFRLSGAEKGDTEGIVEMLRAVQGAEVAALVRDTGHEDGLRVSLRSASDKVDVSALARAGGGGGHRAAAGFSSSLTVDELLSWLTAEVAAQLNADGAR